MAKPRSAWLPRKPDEQITRLDSKRPGDLDQGIHASNPLASLKLAYRRAMQ